IVPNALTDGILSIEVSVEDVAGNSTTVSESATLDTNAPSININALADTNQSTPTISGTTDAADGTVINITFVDSNNDSSSTSVIVSGTTWSVVAPSDLAGGSYTVTATINDISGNSSSASVSGLIDLIAPSLTINTHSVSNDITPTVSGNSDAPHDSVVNIIVTGSNGDVHTFTAIVGSEGDWSAPVPSALVEGSYSVSASVSDAAGNSISATSTGEVDITPPTLILNNLGSSSDVTPTLSGSSNAVEGSEISITVLDDEGVSQIFTTEVDSGGEFSVEVPDALAEGAYTLVLRIDDIAGNTTTLTSAGVIDTLAPSVSVNVPSLTNEVTPVITGTSSEANSTVSITVTGADTVVHVFDVQTDSDGNWSATPPSALAEGSYTVSVSMTDAAQNTTVVSGTGEVDVTPPEL
ncbi:Ig-like domain-containing protein, partial [Pseudoalteromonas sp. Z9A5]